jgi:hypothetical protein
MVLSLWFDPGSGYPELNLTALLMATQVFNAESKLFCDFGAKMASKESSFVEAAQFSAVYLAQRHQTQVFHRPYADLQMARDLGFVEL